MLENTKLSLKETNEHNNVTPLRSFEELKPEEQKKVLELKKTLDDFSSTSLINFSSATSSTISRDTDDFLRNTKLNDLQDFNEIMIELSQKLKSVDTKKLSEVKDNPFEKWPILGSIIHTSIGNKINAITLKQQSVEKVVDSTSTVLEKARLSLQEDLIRCDSMKEKNIEYAKQLEFECIALQIRKKELEQERERFSKSSEYNSNNLDDVEYLGKLSDGIQEISRKVDNTVRFRLLAIQDLPTLKITRNADIALINTIEDAIINLIPQWKKAFSKALLSYRLYNAATVMENVHNATEEIFEQSAKISSEAIVKSAKMVEKPQIASETLRNINEILISMCNEIVDISAKAEEMRQTELPELKRMEQEALEIESNRNNKK